WIMEQDVAEPAEIDNAIRWTIGFRLATMGPLELIDFGGLDTWLSLLNNLMPTLCHSRGSFTIPFHRVCPGVLWTKSGEEYFEWGSDFPSRSAAERIRQRDSNLLSLLRLFHR